MFTIFIIVVVFGFGGFAYLRTGGIARATEKKINQLDINKAVQQNKAFGGRSKKRDKENDDILKLKLGVLCAGLIFGFYKYKYLPDKQKVKDKYDTDYLFK